MAAAKYLTRSAGRTTLASATVTSAGAADDGKIPALDSTGRLSSTMMPTGIGADTASIVTSENLAAGDLVNVYNNGGTPTARKADASVTGKEAVGFVLAGSTSPAAALVYFEGQVTGLTGMTPGARQYLSGTTPGQRTETPVTSPTNSVDQFVGTALSATVLSFEPDDAIVNP